MKKLILGSLLTIAGFTMLKAQDMNDINKYMLLGKYTDAKPLVDKGETNDKINKKPEFWATKINLYANLSKQPNTAPEQAATYRATALAAWEKYKEIDPTYAALKDNISGPFALYLAYINEGFAKFNAKDYTSSYTDFKTSADISDILVPRKLLNTSYDTAANLYAGASAQYLKKEDDAVMMFTKIADRKIAGPDNEFVYQYLTNAYYNKKDEANFKKYDELGKSLYPKSTYFPSAEEDYMRQSGDFNKLVAYNEGKVAADPNNYTTVYDLGTNIYTYLYPQDTTKTPKGDVSDLENKMIAALQKAAELKPDTGMPNALLGTIYVNKAAQAGLDVKKVNAAMKNANVGIKPDKNGKLPPIPKELLAKKEDLYKKYDAYEDTAIIHYEKAATAFEKAKKLESFEKQQYKISVNYLIDLNDEKKGNSKVPAQSAKYAAESKKWNLVYDKIK